jgi:hypothetical protein
MRFEISGEHVDRFGFLIALLEFVSVHHCRAIRAL